MHELRLLKKVIHGTLEISQKVTALSVNPDVRSSIPRTDYFKSSRPPHAMAQAVCVVEQITNWKIFGWVSFAILFGKECVILPKMVDLKVFSLTVEIIYAYKYILDNSGGKWMLFKSFNIVYPLWKIEQVLQLFREQWCSCNFMVKGINKNACFSEI